ncbi:MAG: TlpA family protein disulfide reductase [Methylococcaceae bacterium]|nr:TlpA family protein disulfide reductase [Methylococcaceae bacterium]
MPEPVPHAIFKTRFFLLAFLLPVFAFLSIGLLERVSNLAPRVTFHTLGGQKLALKALETKPLIVTFWASDCPACIKEVPDLIDLYKQYHPQGLEIIAVTMYYDPPNRIINLVKELQVPYPVALDLNAEIARAFGDIQLIPSTFLIAPDGSVALKKIGTFEPADMKARIETLLKG